MPNERDSLFISHVWRSRKTKIAYETHRSAVQSAHDNPFALVPAPLSVVYQRAKEGDSVRVPECHVLGIDFAEVMAVRGFVPQWS